MVALLQSARQRVPSFGIGVTCVLSVVAALSLGGDGAAAAAPKWAWTKKQAEYYVGGDIGIATACAPVGSPYRKGGVNYYYRFTCAVAFTSGAQFLVTLQPTGAKTYRELNIRQISEASPAPSPSLSPITPTPTLAPTPAIYGGGSTLAGCYYRGHRLSGRVQVVDYLPDFRVQIVDYLPDLRVMQKEYLATGCGEWQFVDYLPDFRVQFVDYLPDFRIQFVSYLPGVP